MLDSGGFELTADEGSNLQFICNASGNPDPFFLWYKNNAVLQLFDDR